MPGGDGALALISFKPSDAGVGSDGPQPTFALGAGHGLSRPPCSHSETFFSGPARPTKFGGEDDAGAEMHTGEQQIDT